MIWTIEFAHRPFTSSNRERFLGKISRIEPLNQGKTSNIEHRTPNAEVSEGSRCHSMFGVGRSMLDVRPGSWVVPTVFQPRIGTLNHPPHPPFGHPLPLGGGEGRGEGSGSWKVSNLKLGAHWDSTLESRWERSVTDRSRSSPRHRAQVSSGRVELPTPRRFPGESPTGCLP